jgi:hypothetical protein
MLFSIMPSTIQLVDLFGGNQMVRALRGVHLKNLAQALALCCIELFACNAAHRISNTRQAIRRCAGSRRSDELLICLAQHAHVITVARRQAIRRCAGSERRCELLICLAQHAHVVCVCVFVCVCVCVCVCVWRELTPLHIVWYLVQVRLIRRCIVTIGDNRGRLRIADDTQTSRSLLSCCSSSF